MHFFGIFFICMMHLKVAFPAAGLFNYVVQRSAELPQDRFQLKLLKQRVHSLHSLCASDVQWMYSRYTSDVYSL
ncbi:hypothetical protein SAMN05428964_10388 [Thalassospira xiamenensis]|uniref:Uncharacterized protein n=1 Tax=Thalassospira xiamenensis TaxID=220697 RepID=A0A285TE80_9PROT|nr:hypothetical protein SAMN05428964_10388 [Thalassospira xiamenensis]